jgi:hypothetical protein
VTGGALGLASLVTIALRHAGDQIHHGVAPALAATDGYVLSFRMAAALLATDCLLVLALLERVSTSADATPATELGPN